MKALTSRLFFIVIFLWTALLPANAQVNVTQKNNNLSRDGLYIDAAFTPANAANLIRDLNFNGTISGNVYAQPLYIEGGPNGSMVIAVTESNNVYALDANDGSIIWQRNLGPAVTSGLPCGNINPFRHQRHARRRSCLPFSLCRCDDRWSDEEAFRFFVERGHWRDECWLAGRSECHRKL